MTPSEWEGLVGGLIEFFGEEMREPEHGDEDPTIPGPEAIGHPETTTAPLEAVETMTANRNPDDEPGPWDAADMGEEAWAGLRDGLLKFLAEEMAEPEHAEDAAGNAYVSRPLLNGDAVSEWAQRVGLKDVVPADKMRIAVGFSRGPVPGLDADRLAVKDADGELNGTRSVGRMRMNDTGPVVLGFYSPDVMERRRALDDSAKYRPEERPYVVIAGDPGDVDLSDVAPYSGSLEFGPEEASTLGDGQYGATGQVIFVSRKGKVLFLRRASGVAEAGEWDLPGGHVEQGEDAQVAARRESLEETGVPPPTALRLVDRVSFDGEDHTTFAAEVGKRFKPALSDEHVDWKWADPRKPPQPLRPVVAAALAAMSKSAAAPGPVAEEHFGAAVMYVEPDGRVLFLRRKDSEEDKGGRWDLPGGRAKEDEEPEETAIREAAEESGRKPKNLKLVDKGPPLAGAADQGYFATFASKSPRFIPKISDEHSDHLWAHPSRPPRPLHPGVAAVLTRLADGMSKDSEDPPGGAVDPDAMGGVTQDQPGGGNPDQDAQPGVNRVGPNASPDQDVSPVVLDDNWEEGKHPRGKGGEFASTDSSSTPKSFWSYQSSASTPSLEEAIKAGAASSKTTQKEWEQLSPGMRREIMRGHQRRAKESAHDSARIAGKIDRDHDGPWMSCKSKDSLTTYINKNVPKEAKIKGKAADVDRLLVAHEDPEWDEIVKLVAKFEQEHGRKPKGKERVAIYNEAHEKRGIPGERAEAERQGIDWDGWNAWCRGQEAKIEKGPFKHEPKDADVQLTGHRHNELEIAIDIAIDSAVRMAFDYATEKSSRQYDPEGRLHVERVNICREGISPYIGSEVPNWEELGLDPNKIYKFYRPGDELEKAYSTSNGIPVLRQHRAVSAADHSYWDTVGSIGTRAEWEAPFVKNDISVWPADDIEGVERKTKTELSPGYRYRPNMVPGKFEGEDFDGRMEDICFNHIAIVETGRQGPAVVISDSADDYLWRVLSELISETV